MFIIKFADSCIRTSGLCYWKQPFAQLSHNHCPRPSFLPVKFFTMFLSGVTEYTKQISQIFNKSCSTSSVTSWLNYFFNFCPSTTIQIANLFFQYLAVFNHENLPNIIKICQRRLKIFSQIQNKPSKTSLKLFRFAKVAKFWQN